MELKHTDNAVEFKKCVLPFLQQNEAQNCLGLGIIETLILRPEAYPKAYLWQLTEDSQVIGVAWMTPPHPIGLTEMPDEALKLVIEEASRIPDRPLSVVGPKSQADRFRDLWTERHNVEVKSTMEQRIYQATRIVMPFQVKGSMRQAVEQDRLLLEEWNLGFSQDCGLQQSQQEAKNAADIAIKNKSRYLWIVDDKPVSMAGAGGPTPSGIRLSWVYTPVNLRSHGYASAITAALSQKMLSEGRKFCFLYTDLANPTSNSIYQKIGYEPVCDSVHHTFKA